MNQAEVENGERPGLGKDERAGVVRIRGGNRVHAMEIEIPKRALAYYDSENVLPKSGSD